MSFWIEQSMTSVWQEVRAGWRFLDISQLGRARTPEGKRKMQLACREFGITRWRLILFGGFTIIEIVAIVVLFGIFINSRSFTLALLYLVLSFPMIFVLAPVMVAHIVGATKDDNYQLLRTLENRDLLRYQRKLFQ